MRLAPGPDGFTIDATDLGALLRLPAADVRAQMLSGAITTRFERGEGEDAGRFRLTFQHGPRRVQLIVNAEGSVLRRTSISRAQPPDAASRRPE
jgi:hypothetical protein